MPPPVYREGVSQTSAILVADLSQRQNVAEILGYRNGIRALQTGCPEPRPPGVAKHDLRMQSSAGESPGQWNIRHFWRIGQMGKGVAKCDTPVPNSGLSWDPSVNWIS